MSQQLLSKKYWENNWNQYKNSHNDDLIKFLIKKLLTKNIVVDKNKLLLLEICEKYFPKKKRVKIIEVGCAPAIFLLDLGQKFNFDIYGIEYTRSGYCISRENFIKHNRPTDNLIYGDFFSSSFQRKYKEFFDIVFSRGFIEHYKQPESVIKKHEDILKKNGVLLISIPNFSSYNGKIFRFFNKQLLAIHNTDIMNHKTFCQLFKKNFATRYCGYFGWFSFSFFSADTKTKQLILKLLCLLQRSIEKILSVFVKRQSWGKFSSQLLFIGKKL